MARPVAPIGPGIEANVVFAKDQPEYAALPCHRLSDGMVVTRWKLSLRERIRSALTGNIWVSVLTFNGPIQPLKVDAECPLRIEPESMR